MVKQALRRGHRSALEPWTPVASWLSPSGAPRVGSKARGLLRVPRAWVPAFVALVPREEASRESNQTRDLWCAALSPLLGHESKLLLRSDGPQEQYHPGAGRTIVVGNSVDEICETLRAIRESDPLVWPLLQVAVEPAAVGALANDRRVSPRRDTWLVEGPTNAFIWGTQRVRGLRLAEAAGAPLSCGPRIRDALRLVAGHLEGMDRRYRVEWCWDGGTAWVVQADELPDAMTDPLAQRHLMRPGRSAATGSKNQSVMTWTGPKANSHRLFSSLGWPVVPLDARDVRQLSNAASASEWLQGLIRTHPEPLVLRTDLADQGEMSLLPTSTATRDLAVLEQFVSEAVETFRRAGIPLHRAAVVASPLVSASVSALAHANPAEDLVRIDGLWGYPDGLLYLPHDSFVCAGQTVRARIRHKPACVLLSERGRQQVGLGQPWDWARTLRPDEAIAIAQWSRTLADRIGTEVQLMVLARVGGTRGSAGLLPFHWFRNACPYEPGSEVLPGGRRLLIRGRADLQPPLAATYDWIDLQPELEIARDVGFLRAVASLAVALDLPVGFSGSRLGHARYVLESTGATVFLKEPHKAPATQRGVTVVARSTAGLLRLRYLERRELVAALAGHQLGASEQDLDRLVEHAARRRSHPAFPGIPWLEDDVADSLSPALDEPGYAQGFMDDQTAISGGSASAAL